MIRHVFDSPDYHDYSHLSDSVDFQENMSQVACDARDVIFIGQFI